MFYGANRGVTELEAPCKGLFAWGGDSGLNSPRVLKSWCWSVAKRTAGCKETEAPALTAIQTAAVPSPIL